MSQFLVGSHEPDEVADVRQPASSLPESSLPASSYYDEISDIQNLSRQVEVTSNRSVLHFGTQKNRYAGEETSSSDFRLADFPDGSKDRYTRPDHQDLELKVARSFSKANYSEIETETFGAGSNFLQLNTNLSSINFSPVVDLQALSQRHGFKNVNLGDIFEHESHLSAYEILISSEQDVAVNLNIGSRGRSLGNITASDDGIGENSNETDEAALTEARPASDGEIFPQNDLASEPEDDLTKSTEGQIPEEASTSDEPLAEISPAQTDEQSPPVEIILPPAEFADSNPPVSDQLSEDDKDDAESNIPSNSEPIAADQAETGAVDTKNSNDESEGNVDSPPEITLYPTPPSDAGSEDKVVDDGAEDKEKPVERLQEQTEESDPVVIIADPTETKTDADSSGSTQQDNSTSDDSSFSETETVESPEVEAIDAALSDTATGEVDDTAQPSVGENLSEPQAETETKASSGSSEDQTTNSPGQSEVVEQIEDGKIILWSEDFDALLDGATSSYTDGKSWSTDDSSTNVDSKHGVKDGAYSFGHTVKTGRDGSEESSVSFQTEAIDISGHSDLSFSFDLVGGGGLEENGKYTDHIKVFAIVDGETHEVFVQQGKEDEASIIISDIPEGNELVLEFETRITSKNEFYQVDNLMLVDLVDEEANSGDDDASASAPPIETVVPDEEATSDHVTSDLVLDDHGNPILWSEDFDQQANGTTDKAGSADGWSTDDSATNLQSNHGVQNGAYRFGRTVNLDKDGNENSNVSFKTDPIDISGRSDLGFSFTLKGGGGLEDSGNPEDYIKVFALVDGVRHELFAEHGKIDGDGKVTISNIPQGDELVLEFENRLTWNDEYYEIDDLSLIEVIEVDPAETGEEVFLPTDAQGNDILWSEDFSNMADGQTTDTQPSESSGAPSWFTDASSANIQADHGVRNEAYHIGRTVNTSKDGKEGSTVNFQTEAIDISGHSDVRFSFDISGGGSLNSNGHLADYMKVFATVDGERHEVFTEMGHVDEGSLTISDIPRGNELILEFESLVTGSDEYYQIDNLVLTGASTEKVYSDLQDWLEVVTENSNGQSDLSIGSTHQGWITDIDANLHHLKIDSMDMLDETGLVDMQSGITNYLSDFDRHDI